MAQHPHAHRSRRSGPQPQREMMAKATRLHGLRSALALAGLVALVSIGVVVRTQVAKAAGSDPHRRARRSPGECGTESVARHCQRTRCESRGCCDLSCRRCVSPMPRRSTRSGRNCMLASRWFPATGRSSNHCWKNCSPTRSLTSARFVSNCVPTRVSSRKNSGPSCGTRKPRPFAASVPRWRWRITFPNPRRPRGPSRT